MARRKKRRRRATRKASALTLMGLGVALSKPIEYAMQGNYTGFMAEAGARLLGYNLDSKKFDAMYALTNGYLPIVAGALGSKAATALGINRTMGQVPVIGKYIKL